MSEYWIKQMLADNRSEDSFIAELDRRIKNFHAALSVASDMVIVARNQGMIRALEDLKNTLTKEKNENE